MTLALMGVRQKVNNFESSVVVQELDFAMNSVNVSKLFQHINTTSLYMLRIRTKNMQTLYSETKYTVSDRC